LFAGEIHSQAQAFFFGPVVDVEINLAVDERDPQLRVTLVFLDDDVLSPRAHRTDPPQSLVEHSGDIVIIL
jgi:hypothetical protein